nr:transposase, MuDR, MULE transposase domain protein [Tanacetum cinerariifolium]
MMDDSAESSIDQSSRPRGRTLLNRHYSRDLVEFVKNLHPSKRDLVFLILFVDKNAIEQSFIELESDETFKVILDMYEKEKEVTIYVTPRNTLDTGEIQQKVKTMTEEHTCIRAARVVGDLRYKPVLDLLDGIREMLMVRFHKKRKQVKKWKGTLVPTAENHIKHISKNLVKKFKEAYALEIDPLPAKDQWVHIETEKKYTRLLSNVWMDDQERIESYHMTSPKEDTNVRDAVSMDIRVELARIRHLNHLKVPASFKHLPLKGYKFFVL